MATLPPPVEPSRYPTPFDAGDPSVLTEHASKVLHQLVNDALNAYSGFVADADGELQELADFREQRDAQHHTTLRLQEAINRLTWPDVYRQRDAARGAAPMPD